MKVVIYTQVYENYGAHDWSGEGECPQYWKAKGGDTYVVPNLSAESLLSVKELINELAGLIDRRSHMFEETIANWSILDDDAVVCEEWESPTFLTCENGTWRARQVQDGRDSGFHRSIKQVITEYALSPNGEQVDRVALYVTEKGALTYAEWMAEYASGAAA